MSIDTIVGEGPVAPYIDNGSVGVNLRLCWIEAESSGAGTLQVWHVHPGWGVGIPFELGVRTNFSRNLEHMINDTITQNVKVTESSRNHTVFVFADKEEYTYAKLFFDGNNLRQQVNDFISNYIMEEINRPK